MATNYSNEKIIKCKKVKELKCRNVKWENVKCIERGCWRHLRPVATNYSNVKPAEMKTQWQRANLHSFFFSSWIEYHPKFCHLAFDNSYALILCY